MSDALTTALHQAVENGGGFWVGIQTGIPPQPDLVQFTNPETYHVLAVLAPRSEHFPMLSVTQGIREAIKADNDAFVTRQVRVSAVRMKYISDQLFELHKQVEELYRRKS